MIEHLIRPIFIVGSPRSGTTLLRFMLSSHPNIYIPEETGFIPYLRKPEQLSAPLSQVEVEQLLQRISQLNYLWRDIVLDIRAFYQNLAEPTLTNILDALFRQMIAEHQASRWGDKTPLYVRHIPLIAQIFPEAQFIHVIRDGRDATLSAQKKWGLSKFWYMDNYYLLRNWVANVSAGLRDGKKFSEDQYLEVHYEQLVREPQRMLREICELLKETYDPAMLEHSQLAQQVGPGPDGHTEVMQSISTASVERWRTEMTLFEQKMAHQIAGSLLNELGYESFDPSKFSGKEKAQFALLSIKYQLSEAIRKILYATGFLTLNRNMRRPLSDD